MVYYCDNDGLNLTHSRNFRNTPRPKYNCAGYALGTYSWYCPRKHNREGAYGFTSPAENKVKTQRSVDRMLQDFPDLRVISSLEELQKDEYAILFRHSHDGDFHFLKRGDNGVWYHKNGWQRTIRRMPIAQLQDVWCGRYDGQIVMFAKKKAR